MKTEESKVERSGLIASRVNNSAALCQEQHTIVMVGAFFSALPLPSLRQDRFGLKQARSSVIVGRLELFCHGRPMACRALIG
jgi:predicted aconitase with swiveling domain